MHHMYRNIRLENERNGEIEMKEYKPAVQYSAWNIQLFQTGTRGQKAYWQVQQTGVLKVLKKSMLNLKLKKEIIATPTKRWGKNLISNIVC